MTEIPEDVKLVVELMGAMQVQTNGTNWSLITGLTVSERTYRAQLALVREGVMEVMSQPYMPHPDMVTRPLFPSDYAVEQWLKAHYSGDWRDPAAPAMRCWNCWECRL